MKFASYHPEPVRKFGLGVVGAACTWGRKRTAGGVRRTALGEGGGVVVGVDRFDGNVKRSNRSPHVLKQGHVHRKDAKPVPAGFLRFHVRLQMYAQSRLLEMWDSYHYSEKI